MQQKSKGPELYIALCGAAGTDLSEIYKDLARELAIYHYETIQIRLSTRFAEIEGFSDLAKKQYEEVRIRRAMDAGNALRMAQGPDAIAKLAVKMIREERAKLSGSADIPAPGHAYIIVSLKHPSEYELLRRTYGDAFVMVSVYTPYKARLQHLARLIAGGHRSQNTSKYESVATEIINDDHKQEKVQLGQSVRETFPKGDIFISLKDPDSLKNQLRRAVDIWFGAPFVTPTRQEYGMFHAHAAALKSADLSRQVGAVVLTIDGEIVVAGCNEVPKAGGGVIWEDDIHLGYEDRRDCSVTGDASALLKREMLEELFESLLEGKWLSDETMVKSAEDIVEEVLSSAAARSLKAAKVSNILEYGRIIHAEMAALIEAARLGKSVSGKQLYCTTFPCHMCARHIIAAGITEVIYIEPYPKSLVGRLYDKETVLEGETSEALPGAVKFRPFIGVAPSRYASWFKMGRRKTEDGLAVRNEGAIASRRIAVIIDSVPRVEADAVLTTFRNEERQPHPDTGDSPSAEPPP